MTTITKRWSIFLLALVLSMQMSVAQDKHKFSPEKFDAELQQFIVSEAHLTAEESAKFFPVYTEMQKKQRVIFERMKQLGKVKPTDEKECQKAIRDRDEFDVELKRLQQTYHNRFLDILPASKVYDVIKAEDRFYRRMMKAWGKPRRK